MTRPRKPAFYLIVLFVLLSACLGEAEIVPTLPDSPPTKIIVESETTATDTAVATPTTRPEATATEETPLEATSASTQPPTQTAWPPPAQPYPALSRQPVSDDEHRTLQALTETIPPERNDIALAGIYKDIPAPDGEVPLVTEPLTTGTRQNITVSNVDSNTNNSPEFELKYVSEHAYFWFDTTEGLPEPTAVELEAMGAGFDDIYENSHRIFGPESSPGIDGDVRIHIVNTSPLNLCNVNLDNAGSCYLAGYFSAHDLIPQSIDPTSNAREMFVMNGRGFGANSYLDVLAHEFRHMIEENYDVNDWDWEVEGSAMLAEELLGFPGDGVSRANLFLENPDQQLNSWPEENTIPHYGQGYLLNRYLYNRLGPTIYSEFSAHPDQAFIALDKIAAQEDTDFAGGLDLWLDWLAALVIHGNANAPDKYYLGDGINSPPLQSLSRDVETTVHQFASDYYELGNGREIIFTGSNHTPLLAVQPTSGSQMWLANRANFSSSTLMRQFDLSDVETANLEYDVFYDIEVGYDFAYVTLSTDGGQTWQPLAGSHMQGGNVEDDPSDSALTDRFYTGHADDWVRETIDLTPFTGQEVLLRFEYVTDPILTHGGLAVDNLAIPEIGFYDDAETDSGWQADGFVRATGYVPQPWHLILITFTDNVPQVERLAIAADNTAVIPIPNSSRNPILIVAASAPMTLEPAYYRLSLRSE